MSKKELKDYFKWFQDILPQRIEELASVVKKAPGFELWQADFTPESLDLLGEWFVRQVGTRLRTEDELQEIKSRLSFSMEFSGEDLTNQTFSLATDVGMYLSQVFLRNYPELRWNQPFGNKNFIDYGQPVLENFGAAPFNPVRMLITLAYGVVSKNRNAKSLRSMYDIWAKMIES